MSFDEAGLAIRVVAWLSLMGPPESEASRRETQQHSVMYDTDCGGSIVAYLDSEGEVKFTYIGPDQKPYVVQPNVVTSKFCCFTSPTKQTDVATIFISAR